MQGPAPHAGPHTAPRPVRYGSLLAELAAAVEWAGFLAAYRRTFNRTPQFTPAGLAGAFYELMAYLDKHCFPVNMFGVEEHAHEVEIGEYGLEEGPPPLGLYLLYQGVELEEPFYDFHPLFQLVITIESRDNNWLLMMFEDDIADWWGQLAARYDLPDLDQMDYGQMVSNLSDLPEPWNGLKAAMDWLNGIENPWVDIPYMYSSELDISFGWDDIDELARLYKEAEARIFRPVEALRQKLEEDPDKLAVCLDLVLGRCLVQDGEIISLEAHDERG